jgi:hypothetical protein
MLDRKLLFKQLQPTAERPKSLSASKIWQQVCGDKTLKLKLHCELIKQGLVAVDDSDFSTTESIDGVFKEYNVLAVDGSQIYPDRHMPGGGCALVNTGGVAFSYSEKSKVKFFSLPEVLPANFLGNEKVLTPEDVNIIREKREMEEALKKSEAWQGNKKPSVVLLDGTLSTTHLSNSGALTCELLKVHSDAMKTFYGRGQLIVAYMSAPRTKDISKVARSLFCSKKQCKGACELEECKILGESNDSELFESFLPKPIEGFCYSRSQIFKLKNKGDSEEQNISFFYLNVGIEFARVELPTWVESNAEKFEIVCRVVCDQIRKGRGYPISLSLAHEQAVVKAAERKFFYEIAHKQELFGRINSRMSQKLIKKLV